MPKWVIGSEDSLDQQAVEKWGQDEWSKRVAVCNQKCEELEDEFGYNVSIIIGNQFNTIAFSMKQEAWDDLVTHPVVIWRRLVEKITLGV